MDGREKYRRRIEGRVQFVFGAIFGSGLFLNVAAKVRLRPHHHKHRREAGQFLCILPSYLLEYLRRLFCQCHDMQDMRSFFGRGI